MKTLRFPLFQHIHEVSFIRRMAVFVLAALATIASSANAETYPSKPITLVIQYPVGGPSDMLARILVARLQSELGQPLIVEPRVGAGGNIGTDVVAKAKPDGYTLLLSASGPLAISPWLYKKLPYNPLKDLEPVARIAAVPLVLQVNKASPASDASGFMKMLKARPGTYTFGSSGNGTPQHLSVVLLQSMTGIEVIHVPYKGQAPMATDLMGGQVDFAIDSMVSAMPNLNTGRLRPLAVTSTQRSNLLPDVPTFQEIGVTGYEVLAWYGLLAPPGTPRPIVDQLNQAVRKVLDMPEVRKQVAALGSAPVHGTPEQFDAFIKSEHDKWGPIVKRTGAVAD